MTSSLTVKESIEINAPVSKVWEVLIAPKYIRQWDELPQDFEDFYLEKGRTIEWTGSSKLTVTDCEPHELLRLSLYVLKWELPPSNYNIAYTYNLGESGTACLLTVEIGDFGTLPDGTNYFEKAQEFAEKALQKIKSLSENRL
jgi:uncharacterized protein YndB with AHSA1/START domain